MRGAAITTTSAVLTIAAIAIGLLAYAVAVVPIGGLWLSDALNRAAGWVEDCR